MQCRQARLRLKAGQKDGSDISADRELLDHLKNCPDCARDWQADKTLRYLLAAGKIDDAAGMLSLDRQKAEIEARLAGPAAVKSGPGRLGMVIPGFLRRRPTLSFGTAISVMLLLILTLVPFKYHQTIGYTIRMEGVHHQLVGDIENICDMLMAMGLQDAEVNILGCDTTCGGSDTHACDTTCKLMILELKTREEAERVVAAFAKIEPSDLTTSIEPIRASASGSLLDQANQTFLQRSIDQN
jgi:hypothetical protein